MKNRALTDELGTDSRPRHLRAADMVKEYILEKKLEPGTPLPNEGELARAFYMSRTSIREALKYLSAQGFVEVRHGSGVFVATPTAFPTLDQIQFQVQVSNSAYDDLLEMRFLIEVGIAPSVVKRIEQPELDEMSYAIRQAKLEFKQGKLDLRTYDLAFHLAYLAGSKNEVVVQYGKTLRQFFALEPYGLPPRTREIIQSTLDEHITIYESILREDVDRLTETLTVHLGRRRRRVDE